MSHRDDPRSNPHSDHATCEMEARVLAVHRPGSRPGVEERRRTEAHLRTCGSCRRAARVSSALAVLAAEGPGLALPDPRRLYWRAQVLERLAEKGEAAEQAARPVRWAWWMAGLLAALVVTVGSFAAARELTTAVAGGAADGLERLGREVAGPVVSLVGIDPAALHLVLWLALALLAGASLLAAHSLVEEGG